MRVLGLLVAMLAGAATVRAASSLSPAVAVQPGSINAGQQVTVVVQVTNLGASQVTSVSTTVQAFSGGGSAVAALVATPVPFSNPIASSSSSNFTWVFSGSGCGSIYFSAWATGFDSGSGLTETAGPVGSNVIPVTCLTPSPSFTITPSPTASPVVSATPTPTVSPTATVTPWIVYGTATPGPLAGDASIPGNLFHPDLGQPLQLRYSAPLEGTVQIDLYNRIGGHVRHFERSVSPGSYTELWDGRNDQGSLVATGIYVAQFKAKGLFKTVKFAVVK
jgi:hypothetical protein